VFVGVVMAVFVWCGVASAQTPAPAVGKLIVTVQDPSGGVIPTATVTIIGIEDATKATAPQPIRTSDKGVATFEGLKPGRYAVAAEFTGFDTNLLKDVRVRAGDNKQTISLALKRVTDTVTVTQDRQIAGSSRDVLFGSVMTREQIEALSEDPAEMRRQLELLAGPDARILVDSFEGQELPHKSQIKSIRLARDQFAAESHFGGGGFIDIITSPGIGAVRTTIGGNFHNNKMEAKNPLAPAKGPAQNYTSRISLAGSLIKDKASFNLGINQGSSYATPNLYAATPTGTVAQNLNLRSLQSNSGFSGTLDYAITRDQTIRFGFNQSSRNARNQGLGNFDYLERAWGSDNSNFAIRVNEAGPLGRRFFTSTRFSLSRSNSENRSVVEAPTVRVLDAFNSGGAQQKGGTHTTGFTFNTDLDYVRGRHSWRTGIELTGTKYRSNAVSNYLGTYTFESLDAFNANTPRSFTQRIGDPNIEYLHLQGGIYIQDDIRPRKNLSISPGVRFELQSHLRDYNNVSPRFGITWSPFKSGKTSLRTSWGMFYDWISPNLYQQTLQNDGFRLKEVNLISPLYPDPGIFGPAPAVNRYQFGDDLKMVRTMRVSASINQTVSRRMSISATLSNTRGDNLLVGSNLNTPVGGVRPDPFFANVLETNSNARSRAISASTYFNINLAPMAAAPAAGAGPVAIRMEGPVPPSGASTAAKLFQWRRGLYLSGNYYYGRSENDTDGAFAVPATGDLALEWGPASFDTRHRIGWSLSSGAFKNISVSMDMTWSSAPAITIRTGTDDNGDLIFNDRPAGVGRNSERTASSWDSYSYFSYFFQFGKKRVTAPGGIMISSVNGVMSASTAPAQSVPRYRLSISCNISNITNHRNPSGFSGVITSPFYLKPTSFYGQRSANFSTSLSF
jgi:hypothetical protein